jgi:hypothetical protein
MLRGLLVLAALTMLATADDRSACPVTIAPAPPFVPPASYRPNPAPGTFLYGTPALWTQLRADGTWRGMLGKEGYSNKFFLWHQGYDPAEDSKPGIIVTAKRLDDNTPPRTGRGGTNAYFNDAWAMLTGLTIPSTGCWEITTRYRSDTLVFIVSVVP